MLSTTTVQTMRQIVQQFWVQEVRSDQFQNLVMGKEIGQKIASEVDRRTVAFLAQHYSTKQEVGSRGAGKTRSMGDVWLEENGVFHPINVKTGMIGSETSPNMVALKKLL